MKKVFLICTMCLMALTMYAQKRAVLVSQLGTKATVEEKGKISNSSRTSFSPDNDNNIDTFGYVDLGLSVKWATCNLGATKPEELGDFYAWGEISSKLSYSYFEYKWSYDGKATTLNKYNTKYSHGVVDRKKVLDADDDVAHVKLGGRWRIPTRAEWKELLKKCTWTWTTQGGVIGYKVTSKINGNSIFLPAALYRDGVRVNSHGTYCGYYWSSSLVTVDPSYAWDLYFSEVTLHVSNDYRSRGQSVRPVTE